ncbi:hypothetical protein QBC43DRAFT_215694 [Cladorrhinum sp. PSN259]|nr:hypothetical protein QBC43DRAFT_215694 [Cladorrhinum sp. PSN259]
MQFKMSLAREQHYHGAARLGGVVGGPGRGNMKPSKSKVPEGQLDPEDLTRRLMMVLADQKAYAERKRKAAAKAEAAAAAAVGAALSSSGGESSRNRESRSHRSRQDPSSSTEQANNTKSSSSRRKASATTIPTTNPDTNTTSTTLAANNVSSGNEYHHVPQEAAKQFARTTTPQQMRSNDFIARLHKIAITNSHSQKSAEAPAEVARQLRLSQSQRDKSLQATSSNQKHTFEAEISRLQRRHSIPATSSVSDHHHPAEPHSHNRRSSVLGLEPHTEPIPEDNNTSSATPSLSPIEALNEHRAVDWTQSDEMQHVERQQAAPQQPKTHKKLLLSPLLKPAQSIWGLRGKISSSSSSKTDDNEKEKEVKSPIKESKSPRSPKDGSGSGFFGRFKR